MLKTKAGICSKRPELAQDEHMFYFSKSSEVIERKVKLKNQNG